MKFHFGFIPKLFIFLLLWFGSEAVTAQIPGYYETSIEGKLKNYKGQVCKLVFARNLISFDRYTFTLAPDDAGVLRKSFLLSEPVEATLFVENRAFRLYFHPGQHIEMDVDLEKWPAKVKFLGPDKQENMHFQVYQEAFSRRDKELETEGVNLYSPSIFLDQIDQLQAEKRRFFEQTVQAQRHNLDASFYSFLQAEIAFRPLFQKMQYAYEFAAVGGPIPSESLPGDYYSFLSVINLEQPDALCNTYFVLFLDAYLKHATQKPLSSKNDNQVLISSSRAVMLEEPGTGNIADNLREGEICQYLNVRHDKPIAIFLDGELMEDYWYYVRSPREVNGWVSGSCLNFDLIQDVPQVAATTIDAAKLFLRGDVLEYALAYDLFWRMCIELPVDLRQEAAQLLARMTHEPYKKIVERALEAKNRGEDPLKSHSVVLDIPGKTEKEPLVSTSSPAPTTQAEERKPSSTPETENKKSLAPNTTITHTAAKPKPSAATDKEEVISWREIDFPNIHVIEQPAIVQGQFDKALAHKPYVSLYSDPILFEEEKYFLEPKGDGLFDLSLALHDIKTGYLVIEQERHPFALAPGDVISFRVDPEGKLRFSEENSQYNDYLQKRKREFLARENRLKNQVEQLTAAEFSGAVEALFEEKMSFLRRYQADIGMPSAMYVFALANITYWRAYELLNYPWEKPLYDGLEGPLAVPTSYYQFLANTPLSAEQALPSAYYTYFLDQYLQYEKHLVNPGLNEKGYVETVLEGEAKYYYWAKLLAMACRQGKAAAMANEIEEFVKECPYPEYHLIVKKLYNDAKTLDHGQAAPEFQLVDSQGRVRSLGDFGGKVVVLDFWATWCNPCLYKMRNRHGLYNTFRKEDVVFLYISLDQDKAAWKTMVREERIKGVHLITSEATSFQSSIARKYRIKNLPAGFVIDRRGHIAALPGGVPGSLESFIWQLLEAK